MEQRTGEEIYLGEARVRVLSFVVQWTGTGLRAVARRVTGGVARMVTGSSGTDGEWVSGADGD